MSSDLPTKKDLVKWDQEDALNWTREEYEIPNSKACGGGAGRQSSTCTRIMLKIDQMERQFTSVVILWVCSIRKPDSI